MASAPAGDLTERQRAALEALVGDLKSIFGSRLLSLVAYSLSTLTVPGASLRTLGLVERLTFEDLAKAVPLAAQWQRQGIAVPLLLSRYEFERTLDVFPLEYGSIIANHIVILGENVFAGTEVADVDRRRGCEEQAKSHLIHLREGFLETHGDSRHVARLIASSAPAFRTLLANLATLETGASPGIDTDALAATIERIMGIRSALIVEVLSTPLNPDTVVDPTALLSRYIEASERIWRHVDGWRA